MHTETGIQEGRGHFVFRNVQVMGVQLERFERPGETGLPRTTNHGEEFILSVIKRNQKSLKQEDRSIRLVLYQNHVGCQVEEGFQRG